MLIGKGYSCLYLASGFFPIFSPCAVPTVKSEEVSERLGENLASSQDENNTVMYSGQ